MKIRDRIKDFRRVKASDLAPNPKNWRKHPKAQQDALRGVLSEIGYAGALLARELPDGSLMLIDGHLRAETTPDMEVPVLVLDVDEREADYLLATVDPLGSLAEADAGMLSDLLAGVESESAAVASMLADLAPVDTGEITYKKLDVAQAPPSMAWVLVGIETVRLGEINDHIERIASIPGIICEMSANDHAIKKD